MTISPTPFLAEIAAGHAGPPIPSAKRAYFQQRLRLQVFNFLLGKFLDAQNDKLTKAVLARRIGKTPDVVNRWLGAPSNLTLDTISDLLLGIAGEELILSSSSLLGKQSEKSAPLKAIDGGKAINAAKRRPKGAQSSLASADAFQLRAANA